MIHPDTLCDPQTAAAFLNDDVDDQVRNRFEDHLEHCDACRQRLQDLAANSSLWADAKSFLYDAFVDHDDQDAVRDRDAVTLNFLQPTDDPRMLGRLGTHEICGVIGSGGMGIVLKAFDPSLNRYVAIKVLSPHLASSGAARKRFARESQAAAAVVHDHVIAIYGVETDGPIPYLIMPYIKGESLQRRIDRGGPLAMQEILRIGMQIARGLAQAHANGLVHRDIKPANVLLPMNVERVLITDFGLARTVDDATLTRSGVIAGTPQYMSPEQAKGEAIDTRTDLFSLGSVLYAMAAGRPPFRGDTPYGIIRRIVEDSPTPLRQIDATIPTWFQNLIDRLHAKRPGDRIGSADQAADLMEACLAHLQTGHSGLPGELTGASDRWSRRRRFLVAASLIVSLVAILAATRFATDRRSRGSSPQDAAQVDVQLTRVETEIDALLSELDPQPPE